MKRTRFTRALAMAGSVSLVAIVVALTSVPVAAAPHHAREAREAHDRHVALVAHGANVGGDTLHQYLFPPELVMEHQAEIGLGASQSEEIKRIVVDGQTTFTELKWDMHGEAEKLSRILSESRVDEKAALDQARKVMQLESRLKQAHLSLVIRIKNVLSEEQQAQLMDLRRKQNVMFGEHRIPKPPRAPHAPMAPGAPRAPRAPRPPEDSGAR